MSLNFSNANWTGWITRTLGALVATAGGAVVSYQQALGSIPKPPSHPGLADLTTWAVSGGDSAALIAALASGLGLVASLYQIFGPKPYTAQQGVLDRQHQNKSFAATDDRANARHEAVLSAIAGLEARLAADSTIPTNSAKAAIKTVAELANSGAADDLAIAEQALSDNPQAAADALMAAMREDKSRAAERARQAASLFAPYAPNKAMDAYKEATELDPEHIWSWIELGRLRADYASLADARACFGAALQKVKDERDRAVLHVEFGGILEVEGQLAEARMELEAALGIFKALATHEPSDSKLQQNLSVSYRKLGDIEVAVGDLDTARSHHTASLGIREALSAFDPSSTEVQRGLSLCYVGLGDVEVATGDLAAARLGFKTSHKINEELSASDPGNIKWKNDLLISYQRLGELDIAAGDFVAARSQLEEALNIGEELAASDPGNGEWQRGLSVIHEKLGNLGVAAGDLGTAWSQFETALDIRETLAARDPSNVIWQRDVFISHVQLSQVAHARGDLAAALHSARQGEHIIERLVTDHPDHPSFARDLAMVHEEIVWMCGDQNSP